MMPYTQACHMQHMQRSAWQSSIMEMAMPHGMSSPFRAMHLPR